ncbi:GntR family transcriptional regulator [Oceanobacillus kapialis]|uniref:GntR family transcriptional regulator n=1 Tax=Oceanobacillus kapialis TaxID=481353 RepID=A0ABW5PZS4_9BACI
MFIQLNFESDDPIYTQLIHQIIEGIAKKKLLPGDALPSVRAMAADIGINLHTVNKAYQHLKQEGFILIHRQKGVVIHPEGVAKADTVYMESLQKNLRPFIAESIARQVSEEAFLKQCRKLFNEINEEGETK